MQRRLSVTDLIIVIVFGYAEKGSFVLNNKCGDTLSVWWKHGDNWHKDDEAGYRPNPQEGKVLQRVGDGLV